MAKMRDSKKRIRQMLASDDWQNYLDEMASGGMANVGALFSFLLYEPVVMHRAAMALGMTIARISENEPETARNIIRNFMWHMNEDSGNIGWGIPEAFAETLARSHVLAQNYASILISYIMDLGHADNYCDNDALRRSCYWAVGRFAQAEPELAEKSRPWLVKGLRDEDSICTGNAAWALGQLPGRMIDYPPLRELAESMDDDICEIFNGRDMEEKSVSQIAKEALEKLKRLA